MKSACVGASLYTVRLSACRPSLCLCTFVLACSSVCLCKRVSGYGVFVSVRAFVSACFSMFLCLSVFVYVLSSP